MHIGTIIYLVGIVGVNIYIWLLDPQRDYRTDSILFFPMFTALITNKDGSLKPYAKPVFSAMSFLGTMVFLRDELYPQWS